MSAALYSTSGLDFMPLWGIFILSALLIGLSIEVGYALGLRKHQRLKEGESMSLGGGIAATLGLLAFMLAFTFSSGTNRWDTKKELILAESNAIGTAFLRADLLPEPLAQQARELLLDYLGQRVGAREDLLAMGAGTSIDVFTEHIDEKIGESKNQQEDLWAVAVAAAEAQPSPITALFVNSINEVLDLHQMRVTVTFQQRMPRVFWFTLYCLAVLAMGLAGYEAGAQKGARTLFGWAVALAFSTVILLVVALDRPQISSVNYAPLQELQSDMQKAMGIP